MKSSYDLLRERMNAKDQADNSLNLRFVFEGNSAINCQINGENYKVAIVLKQERDMAYIYTEKTKPLDIGTCFQSKKLHYIITEEMEIIKDVDFNKYIALIANVELEDGSWGYFKSPEESYINTKVEGSTVEVSLQHPILVAAAGLYEIGDKFLIKNRPWEVIETDTIASDSITYYSLKATTIEKASPVTMREDAAENIWDGKTISPLSTVELSTEQGYFKHSARLENIKCKLTQVQFTVPFGVETFEVFVKENGEIKTIKYKVV